MNVKLKTRMNVKLIGNEQPAARIDAQDRRILWEPVMVYARGEPAVRKWLGYNIKGTPH